MDEWLVQHFTRTGKHKKHSSVRALMSYCTRTHIRPLLPTYIWTIVPNISGCDRLQHILDSAQLLDFKPPNLPLHKKLAPNSESANRTFSRSMQILFWFVHAQRELEFEWDDLGEIFSEKGTRISSQITTSRGVRAWNGYYSNSLLVKNKGLCCPNTGVVSRRLPI